jgi:probable rRNA maturation factor
MRRFNRDFRGKDKPTDVLSFSQLEGESPVPSPSLGDLVISVDTTKRQAKEYGVTYTQEFLRLMVHGILHLHGYDHEGVSKAEAQRMRRRVLWSTACDSRVHYTNTVKFDSCNWHTCLVCWIGV